MLRIESMLFRISPYTDEWQSQALIRLIEDRRPEILLFGGTRRGKSLAPRVAARLGTGLIADCTSLRIDEDGLLLAELPTFGGRLLTTIACPSHRPLMATLALGAFAPGPKGAGGEIIDCPWAIPGPGTMKVLGQEPCPWIHVLRGQRSSYRRAGLGSATSLFGGGAAFGGGVGASPGGRGCRLDGPGRAHGQTGAIVRPCLYIACGIPAPPSMWWGCKGPR